MRKLAFDFVELNNITHPFSKTKRLAGTDWMQGFLKRHPELSLRHPEATSISRATGFNKVQVGKFFALLKDVMGKYKFPPNRIYNIDESGLSTVQKPGRILAQKGQKQVGKLTSAERGQNVTVVCCMSANGSYVPPVFLFPRKNMTQQLMRESPPGSIGFAVPSGWMDTDTFLKWLMHFQSSVKSSQSQPALLLLDNHASHRSLMAVNYAREHGIIMLSLPPHCSHKMQPLDRTFFGPLKTLYNKCCDNWMLSHPMKRITIYDIAELFAQAFGKCATVEKGVNGFACTGIFPVNPDIFSDNDYAPSAVTDIELSQSVILEQSTSDASVLAVDPIQSFASASVAVNPESAQNVSHHASIDQPFETVAEEIVCHQAWPSTANIINPEMASANPEQEITSNVHVEGQTCNGKEVFCNQSQSPSKCLEPESTLPVTEVESTPKSAHDQLSETPKNRETGRVIFLNRFVTNFAPVGYSDNKDFLWRISFNSICLSTSYC